MRKIVYPRKEVLQSLYDLTADITPNRFISTRPNSVGSQMGEFLLIRLPQTIYDRGDTYQTTKGQIVLFARDIEGSDAVGNAISGIEDALQLEKMLSSAMELFPVITDRYVAKSPLLLAGGSDGAGFHYIIIQFNITILKHTKTI